MDADLAIIKGQCSKCPEGAPHKFGLRIVIAKKQVVICIDCLTEIITMIDTFKKGEASAEGMII